MLKMKSNMTHQAGEGEHESNALTAKQHHRHYCSPVLVPPDMDLKATARTTGGPKSLQDICLRVLREHTTASNVLDMIRFHRMYALPMDLEAHCMQYIKQAYRVLRTRRSKEELLELLDEDMVDSLEAASEESERAAMSMKLILGKVVELPPPSPADLLSEPSVENHPHSYKYTALITGKSWPHDVDPARREAFLSHAEFGETFGMSYQDYLALPAWRRRVLKQEKRLF